MASTDGMPWPWQYDFPPFFTIQPNQSTRSKQLDAWCSLVLDYCRHHKLTHLDVVQAQDMPLFSNKSINRKLALEGIYIVFDKLASKGNLEWDDGKKKTRCSIFWKSPAEWARVIYKWVSDQGLTGSVLTLYELSHGEETTTQDFHGLEMSVLKRALSNLEAEGKAKMFQADLSDDGGVKFI